MVGVWVDRNKRCLKLYVSLICVLFLSFEEVLIFNPSYTIINRRLLWISQSKLAGEISYLLAQLFVLGFRYPGNPK